MQGAGIDDLARRTACQDFSHGQCYHPGCRFNHSIIDCSRLLRLSQDMSSHVRLKLEYNTAADLDTPRGGIGMWTLSARGGRRARIVRNPNAVEALKMLEGQLSRSSVLEAAHTSHTICKRHLARRCVRRSTCPHRHDLFDTSRVEVISQKLQSIGRTALDSTVSITFTSDDVSSHSGQWHVAFTVLHNEDRVENVFADSDMAVAVTAAESRLSSIPVPYIRPRTSPRASRRNADRRLPAVNSDSPPSYETAIAQGLPRFDSVPEPSFTSHMARSATLVRTASSASSTSLASSSYFSHSSIASAVSPTFPFTSCTRNRGNTVTTRVFPTSERHPLLQDNRDIRTTYNAINQPRQERHPRSEWGRRPQDEGTPLILQFLALVMLSAISWVIIVVITLPCTEASC